MKQFAKYSAIIIFFTLTCYSCSVDTFFDQPSIKVRNFSLNGLPKENTDLLVKCKISNKDWMDADVKKVTYTVTFPDEGFTSSKMTYNKNFSISGNGNVTKSLPLTITTANAVQLLSRLDAGQSLNFKIKGTIYADTAIGKVELTLKTSGNADVDAGFEQFFKQPTITVNSYTITSDPYDFYSTTVSLSADINVLNNEAFSAEVSEVTYTVIIESYESVSEVIYKNTFTINSGETINLTGLTFRLNKLSAASLLTKSTVNFTVKGTYKAISDLGSGPVTFYLPLYTTGTAPINSLF